MSKFQHGRIPRDPVTDWEENFVAPRKAALRSMTGSVKKFIFRKLRGLWKAR